MRRRAESRSRSRPPSVATARSARCASARASAGTAPATIGEWNAWETGSRVASKPRSRARAMTAVRAADRPGDDRLAPGVQARDRDRFAVEKSLDLLPIGREAGHRPGITGKVRHGLAACHGDSKQSVAIEGSGPVQGGELAQTVTDGDRGLDPEFGSTGSRRQSTR